MMLKSIICLSKFTKPLSPLYQTYKEIQNLRVNRDLAEMAKFANLIESSPLVERFDEKNLCLSISLLAEHDIGKKRAIESLGKRILVLPNLSLQGVNQILGSFAKQIERNAFVAFFCGKVLHVFEEKMKKNCPNRELSNIYWASKILNLPNADLLLGDANWDTMDCTDLSLICAGLMEDTGNELWKKIRVELLKREHFTRKDIPSILCSLACAGMNDRELILHITDIIHRDRLMNAKNCPAIVWAIATCDFIHQGILKSAIEILNKEDVGDPMNMRRVTRAFTIWGALPAIERYIASGIKQNSNMSDTLLIWELVSNNMFGLAVKIFRSKSLQVLAKDLAQDNTIKSQLYYMYLASLIEPSLLTTSERNFLITLQPFFSITADDMFSSGLHRQASRALHALEIDHVSEYKEPITGYIVDMYIQSKNIGIEVQGPFHFVTDIETGKPKLRAPDLFKHKILNSVTGMKIIQVTPWNFGPKLKGDNKVHMSRILAKYS